MSITRDLPGIRVVRPLAGDPHRESWLVRLDGERPGPAVLVRPRDAHGARMVRREVSALHRGRGNGLVPLIDVVEDPLGAAVLRSHLAGPRLASALAERERWDAGEVVTVLAPVVEAVERLHRNGVAHGALGATDVVLATSGGSLVDLGHAELFAPASPEAALIRIDAVGRDRDAVRQLAIDLLRRVSGSRSRAAHALADTAEQLTAGELLGALRLGLDDLAAPVPVAPRDSAPVSSPAPAPRGERLVPVVRERAEETPSDEPRGARRRLDAVAARLQAVRTRVDAMPTTRRRLVVAGGAAVTAAAVLLALPTGADRPRPMPSGGDRSLVGAASDETALPEESSPVVDAAIAGDDPLAAALALLEARDSCFAELSLRCLEGVDQQGSAALAADRSAMLALRAGDEADIDAAQPTDPRLVERLGDSALVSVGPETAPASLLLMRSEAGWRIRDWVAAGVG